MRLRVDSSRQTAHYCNATSAKRFAEIARHPPAIFRCRTGTDERNREIIRRPKLAEHEEQRRRVADLPQATWIPVIRPS